MPSVLRFISSLSRNMRSRYASNRPSHGRYHDRPGVAPSRGSGNVLGQSGRDNRPTRYGGGGGPGGDGDSYTHVSYERSPGVGSKVSNSLAGLFFGPVLIFLGCLLLWHNEGWAVKTYRTLNEALDNYIDIGDASLPPRDGLQDRLVHVTGRLEVDGTPPTDSTFGLERSDALSLSRQVEIYQWVEKVTTKRRKLQNGETEVTRNYKYNKRWVSKPVDSSNFVHREGHDNYGTALPIGAATAYADGVKLGVYSVSSDLSSQLRLSSSVPAAAVKQLPEGSQIIGDTIYLLVDGDTKALPGGGGGLSIGNGEDDLIEKKVMEIDGQDMIMYTVKATGETFSEKSKALEAAAKSPVAVNSQGLGRELSRSSGESMIGDIRVQFSEVKCDYVSILAKLGRSNTLVPWTSKQGSGYDVAILKSGHVLAQDMISAAQTTNNVMTWFKRAGGWLLNFIGYSMITQIVSTVASISLNWIPLIGPASMSIINLGLTLANVILATTTSIPVAAVAWIVYRPVLGTTMLVGSLGIFYAASQRGKKVHI